MAAACKIFENIPLATFKDTVANSIPSHMKSLSYLFAFFTLPSLCIAAKKDFSGTYVDANDPKIPTDFADQGEYTGSGTGAQVIGLDKGAFQSVLYAGGLPGAGWDGKNRSLLAGKLEGKKVALSPAEGKRNYLTGSPDAFSATKKFPPAGHKSHSGSISNGTMTLGKGLSLKKVERKSPTMGKKAPKGAITLFGGTNKDEWQGVRVDEKTKLLNTDGSDILTKRKFNDYHMHIEFLLPYRPAARGQGRGNSGFYQIDHFEVQILDSFGLEGVNNE
jgi:hypothetical protein